MTFIYAQLSANSQAQVLPQHFSQAELWSLCNRCCAWAHCHVARPSSGQALAFGWMATQEEEVNLQVFVVCSLNDYKLPRFCGYRQAVIIVLQHSA